MSPVLIYVPTVRSAYANGPKQTASDLKEKISRLGTGERARVTVQLNNKSEVKGYVLQAGAENFVVKDKTGKDRTLVYSEIAEIRGGTGAPRFTRFMAWTAIGALAVAGYFFSKIAIT